MSTQQTSKGDLLEVIAGFIREVVEEDWINETEIGLETSFAVDLELESIEVVALAERLQEKYGDAVDFATWLSTMELDAVIALKVGDLVDYIASCQ